MAALNKTNKTIKHLPGPTDRIKSNQRGGIITCVFWAPELDVAEHLSH
jgi:hypothetical protein